MRPTPSSNPSLPVCTHYRRLWPSRLPKCLLSSNNNVLMVWFLSQQNKTFPYWAWCSTTVLPRCTGPPATGWPLITFAYQKIRLRFLSQDTFCSGLRMQYPRVSPLTRVEGELLIFYHLLRSYIIFIGIFDLIMVFCIGT